MRWWPENTLTGADRIHLTHRRIMWVTWTISLGIGLAFFYIWTGWAMVTFRWLSVASYFVNLGIVAIGMINIFRIRDRFNDENGVPPTRRKLTALRWGTFTVLTMPFFFVLALMSMELPGPSGPGTGWLGWLFVASFAEIAVAALVVFLLASFEASGKYGLGQ
jgi:hypothetical protein